MTPAPPPPHRTAVTRALWLKEWRENRAALIAGLAIFLGLPAFGTVAFALTATPPELVGNVATVTLVVAGWFYAAVLGAQMVCRDFGRREGHFLLARPAFVGQIIRAKLCVGIGHVGGLVLLVWLWERLLSLLSRPGHYYGFAWTLPFAVGLTAACLCMFLLAFAAAAITRQALSAVMLAVLALAVLAAAPFVTSGLTDLFVFPERWQSGLWGHVAELPNASDRRYFESTHNEGADAGALTLRIAGVLLVGSAVLAYTSALLAARWSRLPKLGTKSVAWGASLVMVLMFTTAMREVGSNLPVSSVYWFPAPHNSAPGSIALRGRRLAVIEGWRAPGPAIALFDVLPTERVTAPRYATPLALADDARVPNRALLVFDAQARLQTLTMARGSARDRTRIVEGQPVVKHCRLWRIDWDTGGAALAGELPIPDAVSAADDVEPLDAACEGGSLYVLFAYGKPFDDSRAHREPWRVSLAAYTLSDARAPRLEWSHERGRRRFGGQYGLSTSASFVRGADGHVYIQDDGGLVLDPAHPAQEIGNFWNGSDSGWYSADAGVVLEPGVVVQRPSWGLVVLAVTAPAPGRGPADVTRWREIGRVTPTLLALRGHIWPSHLLAPRRDRVWEVYEDRAVGYDVSDRAHPRRIAQVNTYDTQRAVGDGDLLVLDHSIGFSIVRLPR